MSKREVNYPHTIGFRLSSEAWFRVEQEIAGTELTPHDWCRQVVLDRLSKEYCLSKNERLLFDQFVRTHYLLANGLQLLADDKLSSEEWKKLRIFAKDKIGLISDRALADLSSRSLSDTDHARPER